MRSSRRGIYILEAGCIDTSTPAASSSTWRSCYPGKYSTFVSVSLARMYLTSQSPKFTVGCFAECSAKSPRRRRSQGSNWSRDHTPAPHLCGPGSTPSLLVLVFTASAPARDIASTTTRRLLVLEQPVGTMARAPKKKQRVVGPAPPAADAAGAAMATESVAPPRSTPIKKLVQPAVDPAEAAVKAAAAALKAAEAEEKKAAAAAAAKAAAAAAALKAARKVRRAERRGEKRTAAAAAETAEDDATNPDSPHRGVMYIGHLPHGFYEKEIRGFFSQFGTVVRVRVARSKKTARAKGYGWVQFANDAVARIAAETMNGYLLFGRLLDVHLVPAQRQHERMWHGADRVWRRIPWRVLERQRHNGSDPVAAAARRTARLVRRAKLARRKLAAAGVQYDVPAPIGPVSQPE